MAFVQVCGRGTVGYTKLVIYPRLYSVAFRLEGYTGSRDPLQDIERGPQPTSCDPARRGTWLSVCGLPFRDWLLWHWQSISAMHGRPGSDPAAVMALVPLTLDEDDLDIADTFHLLDY